MSLRILSLSTSVVALSIFASAPSYAFDAKSYFEKWEQQIEAKGNDVTIGSIAENGSDGATLSNIKIINNKDNSVATINSLILQGASEIGDNGFSYEKMEAIEVSVAGNGKKTNEKFSMSIGKIVGTDFSLDNDNQRSYPLWPLTLGSMKIEKFKLNISGENLFVLNFPSLSIQNLKATEGNGFTLGNLELGDARGNFTSKTKEYGKFSIGASYINGLEHFGKMGLSVDNFKFGSIKGSGKSSKGEDVETAFGGMSGQNLFIPDSSSPDRPLFSEKDTHLKIEEFSVSMADDELFGWSGATASSKFDKANNSVAGKGQFEDLFFNVAKMPVDAQSAEFKTQMMALGYNTLTFDYGGSGTWKIDDGLLDMDSLRLSMDNAAALDISMKISGYTKEFVKALQSISAKLQGETDPKLLQAASMEMLSLYSALSFVDAKITTTNNSLVNKVIKMQAGRSGQQPDQMTASLPFMAGAVLPQIGLQDYAQAATNAIANFLNLNGSVTIKVTPKQPVPVLDLIQIQAAMKARTISPAELAKRFNLEITSK